MAVSISSLNCHGFENCASYIKDSMCEKKPDFKLLQETWHLSNNSSVLSNVDSNYLYKETSGVNVHDSIISGRPFGGLATYFMKNFADKVERVNCKNKRICAVKYCDEKSFPLLLLNVYMPCDDQSRTPNPEYVNTLCEIESLITGHTGDVFAGGDWNTDLSRQNAQTTCFKEFILRTGLKLCWDHPLADKQPTYVSQMNGASSCIDHFLLSSNLFNGIVECKVDDGPLNPSDHHEVEISFDYHPISAKAVEPNNNNMGGKIAWHRVDHEDILEYKDVMDTMINELELNDDCLSCENVHCTNVDHLSGINSLCADIIDICLESGDVCFPKTFPKSGRIPKWREDVKPLRDDSLFWHSVWRDAGRPPTGVLAMIMRRTRAKYHKAVNFCKSNINLNRNVKLAESVENNLARDLWAELKKMDENRNTLPSSINGLSDDSEIASIFANKYKTLYNSVPTSKEELDRLRNDMTEEMKDSFEVVNVTLSEVNCAISKLNPGKRDGTLGTFSDHFINCSEKMKILITKMVNAMLCHGFTPTDLLEAVIVSIPKDLRGNLCADDNYRGIALCSALCKIIDLIFIEKYSDLIITSELQFAFKEEHSTNMCTTILKEVCSYYVSKSTDVYICLLDASKAFDRVHYGKMFDLLKLRKIPVIVRRLLLDMYTRQKVQAAWNSKVSDFFTVQNGVKQGGILSPIIFCIYMDELLIRIRDSGLGCHVGHLSYAGLGYADDVTTLAPNLDALQSILHICEEFGEYYNVLWNCGKTKCMKVGGGRLPPPRPITLNGVVLKWKTKVLHLGNYVTYNLSDHDDIMFKKGVFISQVNKLNVKFSAVSSMLRGFLFQNYCCSWYGCQNWDLYGSDIDRMQIEWNKAVRRVLAIPYQTHTNLLPLIIKSSTFTVQFQKRVTKFVKAFVNSNNVYVSFIGEIAKNKSFGALGRNCTRVYNDNLDIPIPELDNVTKAKVIQELLDVKDRIKEMPDWTFDDVDILLEDVCCM